MTVKKVRHFYNDPMFKKRAGVNDGSMFGQALSDWKNELGDDFKGRYNNGELFFKHSRSIRSSIIKIANFFQVIKIANIFLCNWRTC